MNTSTLLVLWGSPLGIAIFFAGLGVLLWGVAKLKDSQLARTELELRQRREQLERASAK